MELEYVDPKVVSSQFVWYLFKIRRMVSSLENFTMINFDVAIHDSFSLDATSFCDCVEIIIFVWTKISHQRNIYEKSQKSPTNYKKMQLEGFNKIIVEDDSLNIISIFHNLVFPLDWQLEHFIFKIDRLLDLIPI